MSVAYAAPSISVAATQLSDRLVLAARKLRRAEHELSVLLAEMADSRLYLELGFSTLYDYADEVLDLSARKTRVLARLGRSLGELPALEAAFRAGKLAWTKARELLRVVTPETDEAWTQRALALTSRELEGQLDRTVVGELPPESPVLVKKPARCRWTVMLESVDAELLASVLQLLRAQIGDPDISDSALLGEICRRFLHDADADAPTSERLRTVIGLCPSCGDTVADGAEVDDAIVAASACDAEVVEMRPGPERGHLSRTVPPARRRAVLERDRRRCVVPGCRCRLWIDLHHLDAFAGGGDHGEENLVTLCTLHHRLLHEGRLGLSREGDALVIARAGEVKHVDQFFA